MGGWVDEAFTYQTLSPPFQSPVAKFLSSRVVAPNEAHLMLSFVSLGLGGVGRWGGWVGLGERMKRCLSPDSLHRPTQPTHPTHPPTPTPTYPALLDQLPSL